jgi:hypothetical protein
MLEFSRCEGATDKTVRVAAVPAIAYRSRKGNRSTGVLRASEHRYMMKLDYAGGEVTVSDDLCHALLAYSAEIAKTGGSENLAVPVITPEGVRGMAEIVVGPASQLLASPTDDAEVDMHDADIITDIRRRSAALGPSKAVPIPDGQGTPDFDDSTL